MTVEEFFEGADESRRLFEALVRLVGTLRQAEMRVTKSQIAFRRHRPFAWAWMPGKYLRRSCAPLVLSVCLRSRDASPRWKQIVEPSPGRFMHHLELYAVDDIDDQVRGWLQAAWESAA